MHKIHYLVPIAGILLAGVFAACGTPDDAETSRRPAPSREELVARLRSPGDAEELHSFRMRTEVSFSGSFFSSGEEDDAGTGTMAMEADVTTEPQALHLTTRIVETGDEDAIEVDEMIVFEDALWRNRGDGWYEEEIFLPNITEWLLDSFTELRNPIAGMNDAPEALDMLREAEIVGTEEIDGHRTTHFRMTTEQIVAMMMAEYEEATSADRIDECDDLETFGEDMEDDKFDFGAVMDAAGCWIGAVQANLPAPDEYVERFDVDLWVSDDGLVLRQTTVMAYSFVPFFDFDELTPMMMSMNYELYDLNADIDISSPSRD